MDPQPAPLRLGAPQLARRDVVLVQRLLGVAADGEYGPATASAVRAWKRSRGDSAPSGELSLADRRRLLSEVPLSAARTMERWAAARLREEPPGSNCVPALTALAERLGVVPWIARMGYPWCAFAVFLAALLAGGEAAAAALRSYAFNGLYAPAVLAAAQRGSFGLRIVPARRAFRGDVVLFDWNLARGDPADHVARLVSAPVAGRVQTVDGNAGGDGVVSFRARPLEVVRAFVRDA